LVITVVIKDFSNSTGNVIEVDFVTSNDITISTDYTLNSSAIETVIEVTSEGNVAST